MCRTFPDRADSDRIESDKLPKHGFYFPLACEPLITRDVKFDIPLLFEDSWLIAVNKPAGLAVHSSVGSDTPDLQSIMRERFGRSVFLFHRLDKDTSGIILLGKRPGDVAAGLTSAFEKKQIRKAYLSVVKGRWPSDCHRVVSWMGRDQDGRPFQSETQFEGSRLATTTFRVLAYSDEKSWIEALPKTGRTHQIRLHCQLKGHSILGDRVYGDGCSGDLPLALHAYRLDFRHPHTGESISLRTEPPVAWREQLLDGFSIEGPWRKLFTSHSGGSDAVS